MVRGLMTPKQASAFGRVTKAKQNREQSRADYETACKSYRHAVAAVAETMPLKDVAVLIGISMPRVAKFAHMAREERTLR